MPRKNGLTLPLHPLQVISWAILLEMIVTNYVLVRAALSADLQVRLSQVAFTVMYTILQVTQLALGAVLTTWDPTDKVVYEHRRAIESK